MVWDLDKFRFNIKMSDGGQSELKLGDNQFLKNEKFPEPEARITKIVLFYQSSVESCLTGIKFFNKD
jgi:hypothetical protein